MPEATRFARLIACFAQSEVALELLMLLEDHERDDLAHRRISNERVLEALIAHRLIRPGRQYDHKGRTRRTVTMHPLVHEVNRAIIGEHRRLQEFSADSGRALVRYASSLNVTDPLDWPEWTRVLPHCEAILQGIDHTNAAVRDSMLNLANDVFLAFRNQNSLHSMKALANSIAHLVLNSSDESLAVLTSRHNRAEILLTLGYFAEAEAECRYVASRRQQELGPAHPDTLGSNHNLALTLTQMAKFDAAERLYRDTLFKRRQILGPSNPKSLSTQHNLAQVLHLQGTLDAAASEFRQVLQNETSVLGFDNVHTMTTRHNLACVLRDQGHLTEAEEEFHRVLATRVRVLGNDNPRTISTRRELARTEALKGKLRGAARRATRARRDLAKVLGPAHPETAATDYEVGIMYLQLGNPAAAARVLRNSYSGFTRGLGETHPWTTLAYFALKVAEELESGTIDVSRLISDAISALADVSGRNSLFCSRVVTDLQNRSRNQH